MLDDLTEEQIRYKIQYWIDVGKLSVGHQLENCQRNLEEWAQVYYERTGRRYQADGTESEYVRPEKE